LEPSPTSPPEETPKSTPAPTQKEQMPSPTPESTPAPMASPPTLAPSQLPTRLPPVQAPKKAPTDCINVACTKDICPDGFGRRQIGDDCCSCETLSGKPLTQVPHGSPTPVPSAGPEDTAINCISVACAMDVCPDGMERRQLDDHEPWTCVPTQSPSTKAPLPSPTLSPTALKHAPTDCTGVVCTMDLCPDETERRQVGDDCCSCETLPGKPLTQVPQWSPTLVPSAGPEDTAINCISVACAMDACPNGMERRQLDDHEPWTCVPSQSPSTKAPFPSPTLSPTALKHAPTDCTGVVCTMDLCPDETKRRQVGDDCCFCGAKPSLVQALVDCNNVACTMDACPDGMGRRQVGDDCCSCEAVSPPSPKNTIVDCTKNACTMDVCPDGMGRRQVGTDCCSCDTDHTH
jgi:hypothetical protein